MIELIRGFNDAVSGLLIDGRQIPLDTGNADLQAFVAVHGPLPKGDSRHWIVDSELIREMTPEEQAAMDAELAARQRQRRLDALVTAARVQFARVVSLKTESLSSEEATAADAYRAALLDYLTALLGENPPDPETAVMPVVPETLRKAWWLRYGE